MSPTSTKAWDVFVSHASEDKASFVRPLATALANLGVAVWYDEFSLRLGDSISRSIDKGLAQSRFGVVVVSHAFLSKPWPEYELRGLVAREIGEDRVILPIWHGVERPEVLSFSPPLADKVALDTRQSSAEDIAIRLLREIRPDLYAAHPRATLERMANGAALQELQSEIERARDELERVRGELAEYRCPICNAELQLRVDAPADTEERHWDVRESFACGLRLFGGETERLCRMDPNFPPLEDFHLQFFEDPSAGTRRWQCHAIGRTDIARKVDLQVGYGSSKEDAEHQVRESYAGSHG
jgi:hypothetical protein